MRRYIERGPGEHTRFLIADPFEVERLLSPQASGQKRIIEEFNMALAKESLREVLGDVDFCASEKENEAGMQSQCSVSQCHAESGNEDHSERKGGEGVSVAQGSDSEEGDAALLEE